MLIVTEESNEDTPIMLISLEGLAVKKYDN